jgi:elongation factor Ts
MTQITASMVKELRDATNVSMMECKRSLVETSGNIDEAMKLLRERGMAVAAKRASKEAKQGIIASSTRDGGALVALAEVNCETDFVARNDSFKAFVADVAERGLDTDESLAETMSEELIAKIAEIGESIKIRRNARYVLEGTGKIGSYIHMGGKVGVLVDVACGKEETLQNPVFDEVVKDLTLHVAATAPQCLTSDEVPAEQIAAERDIFAKQVEGKPENIIEKIVDGKVKKYFTEICLVEQGFVKEPKQSITQLLQEKGKELDDELTIRRFVRYQLGA